MMVIKRSRERQHSLGRSHLQAMTDLINIRGKMDENSSNISENHEKNSHISTVISNIAVLQKTYNTINHFNHQCIHATHQHHQVKLAVISAPRGEAGSPDVHARSHMCASETRCFRRLREARDNRG